MRKYLGGAVVAWVWLNFVCGLCGQDAASAVPDAPPLVNTWAPPVYPAALKAAGTKGKATVHFIVDDKGVVSAVKAVEATDPLFGEAAVASVSQWTFSPGVSDGVPTAMGVATTLHFRLPERKAGTIPPEESTPKALPKSEAKAEMALSPDHPADLYARKIGGKVMAGGTVTPEGNITGLELVTTSHPGFVRPMLEAMRAMKFSPAMQGDLPVAARFISVVEFDAETIAAIGVVEATQLELNGLSLRLTGDQTQRDLCSRPPEIWSIPDPVYPRSAAVGGIAGEAVVNFEVDERGNVENVTLISATAPEFGQTLLDTLRSGGTFKPAMKDGRTVAVPMQWKHTFKQPAAEPVDGEPAEDRLIRLLKSGQAIGTAKGLDAPLKPLWRVAVSYPAEMRAEAVKGTADVEFIIDREGRVRLPFAVKATDERFGRAAVIAASAWVFEAPTRGGQPTDVRVRVPFNFSP